MLGGTGAFAQSRSTTPGVPTPSEPNTYPNPQATAPDQTSPDQQRDADRDSDRSNSDQQQYPDTPSARDRINDNGQSTSDSDRQNQSGEMDRNRPSDRDRTSQDNNGYPQSDERNRNSQDQYNNQYPRAGDQRDRSDNSYGGHDRDRVSGNNGYTDQIQSALQQANLTGVSVNDTGSRIELSGTVPSGRDRRQALKIAQLYAHGRQVVDHIQVSGNGHDHDREDQK